MAFRKQKNEIEKYKLEADQAEREGNYGKVAEIRYGRIKEAENQIVVLKEKLHQAQGDKPLIHEEVGAEEIPKWFRVGRGFLLPGCCKVKEKSCSISKTICINV